jgi:hypothetical protein
MPIAMLMGGIDGSAMVGDVIRAKVPCSPELTAGVLKWLCEEFADITMVQFCASEWRELNPRLNDSKGRPPLTNAYTAGNQLVAALKAAGVIGPIPI